MRRTRLLLEIVAIAAIVVLGFSLRLEELDFKPLGGDETTMSIVSEEVARKGYPAVSLSSAVPERIFTTSELVPYFMAASIRLFPEKSIEFQIRFPGVIFGALTILMIFFLGRFLFDTRVALLAALIYALLPIAINIAQFGRYPQQVQFFTLLSAYLFCRSFSVEPIDHRYLFWGAITNILAYLSWEGDAFFFVGMGVGLVGLKGRNVRWIRDKYLWLAVLALAVVVFVQLGFRASINREVLRLGTGITDLTPTDRWNQPLYNLFIFVQNFLFMKNVLPFTVIAALGLPLAFRDRALFYCYSLTVIPVMLVTNLIEVSDFRHVYYVLGPLVLIASRVFLGALDYVLFPRSAGPAGAVASGIGWLTKLAFVGLLVLTATDHVLKLHTLPGVRVSGQTLTEVGDDGGIRSAAEILKRERRPDDRIFAPFPHTVYRYYATPEYYPQNPLRIPILVSDDAPNPPRGVHRITGSDFIYSTEEFMDVLNRHGRVWLVLTGQLSPNTFSLFLTPKAYDRIRANARVVLEDVGMWLYLVEQ
jgi:hypothetical protein